MPTENRSSNTEMVSVPRHTLENVLNDGSCKAEVHAAFIRARNDIERLLAQPAEQHQVEPVAWLVTAIKGSLAGQHAIVPEGTSVDRELYLGPWPVYTHADTVEVERLRASEKALAIDLAKSLKQQCEDIRTIDALRAQLADLKRRHDGLHRDMATIAGREVPKGCTVADYAAAPIADALPTSTRPEVKR